MRTFRSGALVLLLAVCTASAGTLSDEDQAYYRSLTGGWLFGWCAEVNVVAEGYEYWIDYYTNGVNSDWGYWIGGFDLDDVQNYNVGESVDRIRDIWSAENFGRGTDVVMPPDIHVAEDYQGAWASAYRMAERQVEHDDRLWIPDLAGGVLGVPPGLLMTWRVVLDQPYYDGSFWVHSADGLYYGEDPIPVFNMPTLSVPGDFTGEGDVNAADIDVLANAIADGLTDSVYDVNNDSFVDELDLIYHIATLVHRTDGGVGTYRGDFNLDGYVDGTDLAILKAGFGLTGLGYAAGNANADEYINGTDLSIFKATFGFSGTPDPSGVTNPPAVPEPATLGLLGLGASVLLGRRKRN